MAGIAYDYKGETASLKPGPLMQQGFDMVTRDKSLQGGGSTACIAVATKGGRLHVANLGDSGYIQLRLNAVHHWSDPQTHAFNTPYQLAIIPPRVLAQSVYGGSPLQDYPQDASIESHHLEHGDVLVFATDGVWDNMSSQEILKIVSQKMMILGAWEDTEKGTVVSSEIRRLTRAMDMGSEHSEPLQLTLATAITSRAKALSQNTKIDGPFAREVQKHYPEENFHGGKVDDICTVVVVVLQD
jgi:protein phosphatase PTC7